jgi:hypothetical protein
MYKDKTGEYFGLDDLVAGVIGGVLNLGANLLSGNNKVCYTRISIV